jgi:hypothetical protein
MAEFLVCGYTIFVAILMIGFILAINSNNKLVIDSIESGESTANEYEKIFIPIGICGTWLLVKKK